MMRRGHSLNELMIAVSLSMVLMSLIFSIAVNLQGGAEEDQPEGRPELGGAVRHGSAASGRRAGGSPLGRR